MSCPLPNPEPADRITLAHGEGGRLMRRLLRERVLPTLGIDPVGPTDAALLAHCHALAAESLAAERLHQRHAIDPVLSPLLQELIASEDTAVSALAMAALAAQSRFVQGQRRMELPLGELPAELFHTLLATLPGGPGRAGLVAAYDEGASRLGLMARLVASLRRGVVAALALDHAGLAMFASALAVTTPTPRGAAVLACHEGQGMRFALLLRAAGLGGLHQRLGVGHGAAGADHKHDKLRLGGGAVCVKVRG